MNSPDINTKLRAYLKSVASYSVIDDGVSRFESGDVIECHRSGLSLTGTVKNGESDNSSVSLTIQNAGRMLASCTTCEELQDGWCSHAVSLLWSARSLGFFEIDGGFTSHEGIFRADKSSADRIAEVLSELSASKSIFPTHTENHPSINIELEAVRGSLAIRLLADGTPQRPLPFEDPHSFSSRPLDNLLLQMVNDFGDWDEDSERWIISNSSNIDKILGLSREYKSITDAVSGKDLSLSPTPIDAKLILDWKNDELEASVHWVLPDGKKVIPKEHDMIGTGPFWAIIDSTLWRLTYRAAKICTAFPYSSRISLSVDQVSPILEKLIDPSIGGDFLQVVGHKNQPEASLTVPTVQLNFSLFQENSPTGDIRSNIMSVNCELNFTYPTPNPTKNIVFIPNRTAEKEVFDTILSLGLKHSADKNKFIARGDSALDLIFAEDRLFPKIWEVNGLEKVRKAFRISELEIHVTLSAIKEDGEVSKNISAEYNCQIALLQNNAQIPLSILFKNTQLTSNRYILLDSGAYARVPGFGMSQLHAMLGIVDSNYKLSNVIRKKVPAPVALNLTRMEERGIIISPEPKLRALVSTLSTMTAIPPKKPTSRFKGKLRSYQEDGLSWLVFLSSLSLNGILADEMGLGKTVQTLAMIDYFKKGKQCSPTLIIAPTSVMTNWVYEAKKFTPNLSVLMLHGPERRNRFAEIPNHDIVITSYALLRLDRQELEKYRFFYLILDEAQHIKNPEASTTKAAKNLKSAHRLALTGTPTENRPLELWSIIDFLMPSYLGTQEFFKKNVERPILEGGPGVEIARFLNGRTRPFILRRTKSEVEKELPPKIESVLYATMESGQREIYDHILGEVRPKVFEMIDKKGVRGASVSILAALLRLRQVCNHPNSIDSLKDVAGYGSGKFELLKEVITEALDGGHKILLFGQFIEMLSIIKRWLEEQNVPFMYMDGSTKNRQTVIDRFNLDDSIRLFLVSLKTGGTGLNLTAADTVIIYDPWWNPAVEDQATDRAHRIGQTKTVSVYRLVTENSIEQRIMELKEKKSAIVDALINQNGLSTLTLTKSDLESLFAPL